MFRRRVSVLVWMLAVVAIASAPALAQVQTGSILVKSLDDQGAVVPGVTVTISSPVLVSATMTGVTDELGTYRFPSLPPGTYTVKVELQGFQTVSREGIVVSVGNTTPVDLTMKVGNMSETVIVAAESPTIDTTSANVNVHLDAKLLETTLSGRDIWSIIEYKVPPRDGYARCRWKPGRSPARHHRARNRQRPEHADAQRRQRR
jgi:hypothetical protein